MQDLAKDCIFLPRKSQKSLGVGCLFYVSVATESVQDSRMCLASTSKSLRQTPSLMDLSINLSDRTLVSRPHPTLHPSRSPLDEDIVHDSFNQLIAEQTQHGGGESEAFELQRLQRDLDDESRGSDATLLFFSSQLPNE